MKKFKFRLAALLRLRETARDARRAELAEAYRVDGALTERLDDLGRELERVQDQCRKAAGPGTVDVDRLAEAQRYQLALTSQQRQLQQQRKTVADEIDRRRRVLVGASREVRVLEKLRDGRAQRHRRKQNRQEIKRLDEAARQRAAV